MTYSLTCALLLCEQIEKVHKSYTPTAISATGYNRAWPIKLRYGCHYFMELYIKNLKVEALFNVIKNLFLKPKSADINNIMLAWFQPYSEITYLILEYPLYLL